MARPIELAAAQKMLHLSESASSRQLEFGLSYKEVLRLMTEKRCFYTGVLLTESGDYQRTIDRVDSTKGYVTGNVVACTKLINTFKGNIPVDVLLSLGKGIEKWQKNNNL